MKLAKHKGLQVEIRSTLIFFADCDIEAHGHLTQGTIDAFAMQNIEIPPHYKLKK